MTAPLLLLNLTRVGLGRAWLLLNLLKRMQSRTWTKGKGLVYITAGVEEIAWWLHLVLSGNSVMAKNARLNFFCVRSEILPGTEAC